MLRGFIAASLVAVAAGCGGGDSTSPASSNPATETYASSLGVNIASMTKLSSNLYIQDQVVGTGTTAAAGHSISVTYTGWLVNATQFDSNVGKAAYTFTLGVGNVIPGWDQGVVGMKVGGKRLLVIGSDLAYGPQDYGAIPGGSTLVFVVQLTAAQ